MGERIGFVRPLKPTPHEVESLWCIPFEYAGNHKGTRISVSKAKEIAADLRAAIAEAEQRDMLRYFERERKHNVELRKQLAESHEREQTQSRTIQDLQRAMRARRKAR